MEKKLFAGKNAVVIGGTKGTGLCLSKLLAENGASVTSYGRSKNADCEGIKFKTCDFEAEAYKVLSNADFKTDLENADILVYAAGPFIRKTLEETSPEDWQQMALMNYGLPGSFVSSALKFMKNRNFGRIILFGGTRTDSVKGYSSNAAYAGAKTGLSVLVKSVSMEYGQYGITCNAVLPGFTRNAPDESWLISEQELAEKAFYLLSEGNLNGVLLNVDKGWTPKK